MLTNWCAFIRCPNCKWDSAEGEYCGLYFFCIARSQAQTDQVHSNLQKRKGELRRTKGSLSHPGNARAGSGSRRWGGPGHAITVICLSLGHGVLSELPSKGPHLRSEVGSTLCSLKAISHFDAKTSDFSWSLPLPHSQPTVIIFLNFL